MTRVWGPRLGRVEPAVPSDAERLGELVRTSFAPTLVPFLEPASPDAVEAVRAWTTRPAADGATVVVREGARPIAFGRLDRPAHGPAHLAYLCVDEEARGRGLGGRVLRHLLSTTPAGTPVTLDVFRENPAARRLYAASGFGPSGRATRWTSRRLPPPTTPLPPDAPAGRGLRLVSAGVVRVAAVADLVDDGLLGRVRATFPDATQAFVTAPDDEVVGCPHDVVVTSDRWLLDADRPRPPEPA